MIFEYLSILVKTLLQILEVLVTLFKFLIFKAYVMQYVPNFRKITFFLYVNHDFDLLITFLDICGGRFYRQLQKST